MLEKLRGDPFWAREYENLGGMSRSLIRTTESASSRRLLPRWNWSRCWKTRPGYDRAGRRYAAIAAHVARRAAPDMGSRQISHPRQEDWRAAAAIALRRRGARAVPAPDDPPEFARWRS